MINHVRTLLLNRADREASVAGGWYCDPSFVPVHVPATLVPYASVLFRNSRTTEDRLRNVDALMPYVYSPDLAFALEGIDGRTTEDDGPAYRCGPVSVSGFIGTRSPILDGVVAGAVASPETQAVFAPPPGALQSRQACLRRLQSVFSRSQDTSRRFSASLLAYVLQLDSAWSASLVPQGRP